MIRAIVEYPGIGDTPISKYPTVIEDWEMNAVGDDTEIKILLTNPKQDIEKVTVIVQAYNNNGRAYKLVYHEVEMDNIREEVEFLLKGSNYLKGISKAKIFIWDSLENMIPLAEVLEIN